MGQVEAPQSVFPPEYDRDYYVLSGNERVRSMTESMSTSRFFQTTTECVCPVSARADWTRYVPPIARQRAVVSTDDVLIFHSRHNLTRAQFSLEWKTLHIVEWADVYCRRRGSQDSIKYVLVFAVVPHLF